ncbi:hypothetical protein AVEN_118229-1 [Araneus ventricosus]|uniref:Uncharacterized protein n=1 Tax=Araneus ventricosus TaxID=182803 RepID=A0A4Y2JQ91_ARAVE|nr:hypothetical protein AVEN_118229-1 [Araneus ventricosus]
MSFCFTDWEMRSPLTFLRYFSRYRETGNKTKPFSLPAYSYSRSLSPVLPRYNKMVYGITTSKRSDASICNSQVIRKQRISPECLVEISLNLQGMVETQLYGFPLKLR